MTRSTITPPVRGGHSSIVEMALTVDGVSHRVAQMGGDFIILETPVDIPPTKGSLTLEIDGEPEAWQVFLPKGVKKDRARTPVERI